MLQFRRTVPQKHSVGRIQKYFFLRRKQTLNRKSLLDSTLLKLLIIISIGHPFRRQVALFPEQRLVRQSQRKGLGIIQRHYHTQGGNITLRPFYQISYAAPQFGRGQIGQHRIFALLIGHRCQTFFMLLQHFQIKQRLFVQFLQMCTVLFCRTHSVRIAKHGRCSPTQKRRQRLFPDGIPG